MVLDFCRSYDCGDVIYYNWLIATGWKLRKRVKTVTENSDTNSSPNKFMSTLGKMRLVHHRNVIAGFRIKIWHNKCPSLSRHENNTIHRMVPILVIGITVSESLQTYHQRRPIFLFKISNKNSATGYVIVDIVADIIWP